MRMHQLTLLMQLMNFSTLIIVESSLHGSFSSLSQIWFIKNLRSKWLQMQNAKLVLQKCKATWQTHFDILLSLSLKTMKNILLWNKKAINWGIVNQWNDRDRWFSWLRSSCDLLTKWRSPIPYAVLTTLSDATKNQFCNDLPGNVSSLEVYANFRRLLTFPFL